MQRPTRRDLLRGAGVALAVPFFESLAPRSAWAQAMPKRFVLFHWPGGTPAALLADQCAFPDRKANVFYPAATGTSTPFTSTPALLAPLLEGGRYGNFRNDLCVVSGLTYARLENHALGSHGHSTAMFSGYRSIPAFDVPGQPYAGGPTVDAVAAARLGGAAPLAIQLRSGSDHWPWSHTAANRPSDVYERPSELWSAVFRTAQMPPQEQELLYRREKSIIDFVKADADRLRARLGKSDRQRLERYLDSVRSVERTLTLPPPAVGCNPGPAPADTYGHLAGQPYVGFEDYAKTMIRLGVLALECDLTRSLFVSLGSSQNDDGRYTHVDPGFQLSLHTLQHGANNLSSGTNAAAHSQHTRITLWHLEMFGYLMSLLKGAGGAGSLLANSVVVGTSEFSDGGMHSGHFLPVLVAGQARPLQTGRHVAYKSSDLLADRGTPCNGQPVHAFTPTWARSLPGIENRCISDLWQSCLQAVGAYDGSQRFGDTTLWQPSRLSELWS